MAHEAITRFEALQSAFISATKRSERAQARFAAAAGLSAEDDPATLVRRTLRERDAINNARTGFRAPSTSLRLVYAAALAAAKRDGGGLIKLMEALETERKRRGGRRLYAGGSRAALVMLCAGGSYSQVGMYYDILEAIAAPWWRRKPADEESFAALMAGTGETPETTLDRLGRADRGLNAAGTPQRIRSEARFLVAVTDPQIDDFTSAWTALNVAVQQRRGLRQRAGWPSLAMLAAQVEDGSDAGDALLTADDYVAGLRPRVSGMTRGRLAVRLAAAMTGLKTPGAAAADYAAILAAQAAIIAATSASAVAVVAAT